MQHNELTDEDIEKIKASVVLPELNDPDWKVVETCWPDKENSVAEVIYKYGPFYPDDHVMFKGTPVHVGAQDNVNSPYPMYGIFMWCKLNANQDYPEHKAKIVPTGEEFDGKYIGTVIMPSSLVWHVVEIPCS